MRNLIKLVVLSVVAGLMTVLTPCSDAADYYVSPVGSDANNGTSWATAKQTIQEGVNCAVNGDTVWLTNGAYVLTSQITVNNAITVKSVNGPAVTIVNGDGMSTFSRCFYLSGNCVLDGFTVTNGYVLGYGGGIYCDNTSPIINNCIISGNTAGCGGGTHYGTLNNCALSGNTASEGGGAYRGTLNNCTLTGNTAVNNSGGGACGGTLNNCALAGNSAYYYGGGAYEGTLNNCSLVGNSAYYYGGGASDGTLNNCTLTGNTALWGGGVTLCELNNSVLVGNTGYYYGGGAYEGTLNNCILTGNTSDMCGGAYRGTMNNCTLVGNSGRYGNGGVQNGTLNNCIVFYNGMTNFVDCIVRYTCASDAPAGFGNITNAPVFVNTNTGNYRLAAGSPCINAGHNICAPTNSTLVDLDGNSRIWDTMVDMGAYEYGSSPPASQTISFSNPGTQYATNTVYLSATASSGLSISFDVTSGPAVLNGNLLSFRALAQLAW